ncbi:hypothetical protein [Flavobacterium sp.]|uniref:hypothetical protein n=1 Tax=Flavobacterium sp. TaxID=239 RepID=UPI00286DCC01|nr:hypothetical protein [Flavobacterium sp.]
MKKHLFLFLVLSLNLLQAQNQSVKIDTLILSNRNEIRLDIGKLLFSSRLKVAYERFLNKDFSYGISGMYFGENYSDNIFYNSNFKKKYEIEPFVRYSISQNVQRFFYVETFSSICNGNYKEVKRLSNGEYAYYDWTKSNFTNIAFGFAIGYKFYVKEHFCMDFNFGLSSFVYNKKETESLAKFGINLGYRF